MLQVNRNVEQVERPSVAIDPSHVLDFTINFIRRQYVVIAIAVVLTMLLSVIYLITTPPMFTAYARMLIDTRQQVMLPQQQMTWDYMERGMVDSQVEVLKSENIARTVVKETGDPDIIGSGNTLWGTVSAAIFGDPPPEVRSETELTKRAIDAVMGGVSARRVGLTYVIQVGFEARSPDNAAQIANAVVEAYIHGLLIQNIRLAAGPRRGCKIRSLN